MIRPRAAAVLIAFAVAAVSLAGCASATPSAAPTVTVTVTPSSTPTPSPTPTVAKTATFPTDCAAVGTAASRKDTVDGMTLQGDGTGFVRPAPDGATLKLGCDWIEGDATGILLLISEATPQSVTTAVAGLTAQGYSCGVARAGNPLCTKTVPGGMGTPDAVETIYARDNAWIFMSAVNVDGGQLLSDLAVQMWP
ncbi:hypothetical protein [Microbacterium rhizomatis]|uniref:DUF3558 domain-containing protein n=1 Tax=Microbacterium rhizomatis TaxID=1631477 RepID=A0A5J5J3L0_9MICO|nr:hypothetical protein [Microbacterium rhizomatis]KAA9110631.1 hypothetical protein F6B43_02940 [Microbacterium rhizomatis]